MPVSTRARERKAAEVSANVHFLRSSVVGQSNVVHSTEQSAKKRKQQQRRKSTERQRASPAKKAAVQAKDAVYRRKRRADAPAEVQASEQARDTKHHQEMRADMPEDRRATLRAQNTAHNAMSRAQMSDEQRQEAYAQRQEIEAYERARVAPMTEHDHIRKGSHTCDTTEHLKYVTHIGFDQRRTEFPAVLEDLSDCTADTLEKRWACAKEYKAAMCDRMYHTLPCACCGDRVPKSSMHVDIGEDTLVRENRPVPLLDSLISTNSENALRVRLLNGTKDYALHESYADKPSVSICSPCYEQLAAKFPRVPKLSLKGLDIGVRPMVHLLADGCAPLMQLPCLKPVERMIVSPVMHTRYMTTAYNQTTHQHQSVALSGHITAFPKPTPEKLDAALRKKFPASIAELHNVIHLVLVTAGTREEALEKARFIPELTVDGRVVQLWANHLSHAWSQVDIDLLKVRMLIIIHRP